MGLTHREPEQRASVAPVFFFFDKIIHFWSIYISVGNNLTGVSKPIRIMDNYMKKGIHPDYHTSAIIKCACGAQYVTGSTAEHINIELCAACHPFFTGKQKIVDSAGRVEKFSGRSGKKALVIKTSAVKTKEKAARAVVKATKKAARDTSIKTVQI